jgi:hypothetical protein
MSSISATPHERLLFMDWTVRMNADHDFKLRSTMLLITHQSSIVGFGIPTDLLDVDKKKQHEHRLQTTIR